MIFRVPKLDFPRGRDEKGSISRDAQRGRRMLVGLPTARQLGLDDVPFGDEPVFGAAEQFRSIGAPTQVVHARVGVATVETIV